MRGTVIIMAKAPDLGRAKTRLAAGIGPRAVTLCRLMLARTFAETEGPWRRIVAVTPRAGLVRWRRFWPRGAALTAQPDGDLGRRLAAAMASARKGPVVFLGGDAPALRRRRLCEAFRLLGRADAVFGPATDGGFWLLGLARRRPAPRLFADVRWSTEHALADTRAGMPPGFRVAMLETMTDVDDAADLAALAASPPSRAASGLARPASPRRPGSGRASPGWSVENA